MTRIDFHSNVSNQLDYACRLTRKALAAGCRMVVRHQDEAQLAEFDQLLWSFSATDFLPHVRAGDPLAQMTAVLLSLEGNEHVGQTEILLNLSDRIPADFSNFERLIEIVPQDTKATQAGRGRYRQYQQQGYQLNHILAK